MAELLGFQISELTAAPGTVYVLHCNEPVSPDGDERCRNEWHRVWRRVDRPAPPLLIVDRGSNLIALTDAALIAAGLMRIPAQ